MMSRLRGKELRLEQQFFFVSCSLQDMLRITAHAEVPIEEFHVKFALQLNDTHPFRGRCGADAPAGR